MSDCAGEEITGSVMYERGINDAKNAILEMLKNELGDLEVIRKNTSENGKDHFEGKRGTANLKWVTVTSDLLKYTYQIEQVERLIKKIS